MSTLKMEREFSADPERVFAYVTQPAHLVEWWGHEGTTLVEHQLDFSRPGPWFSIMMNAEGGTHKVSGEVLRVEAPHLVEFTWGWHDADDLRGHQSTVRFEVHSNGRGGALLTLIHRGLANEESVSNHKMGWTATFTKLERFAR